MDRNSLRLSDRYSLQAKENAERGLVVASRGKLHWWREGEA